MMEWLSSGRRDLWREHGRRHQNDQAWGMGARPLWRAGRCRHVVRPRSRVRAATSCGRRSSGWRTTSPPGGRSRRARSSQIAQVAALDERGGEDRSARPTSRRSRSWPSALVRRHGARSPARARPCSTTTPSRPAGRPLPWPTRPTSSTRWTSPARSASRGSRPTRRCSTRRSAMSGPIRGSGGRSRGSASCSTAARSASRASPRNLQDPLTFRNLPQIQGACRDVLDHVDAPARDRAERVAGQPDRRARRGAGVSVANFEILPLAAALDYLRLVLATALTSSAERIVKMLDTPWSGLPTGLTPVAATADAGLTYLSLAAQSLAVEARLLAQPVSFELTSTAHAEGIEDRTTMAPLAARRAGGDGRARRHDRRDRAGGRRAGGRAARPPPGSRHRRGPSPPSGATCRSSTMGDHVPGRRRGGSSGRRIARAAPSARTAPRTRRRGLADVDRA